MSTHFHTCPLCEATCGLAIEVADGPDGLPVVNKVRGDEEDVFSRGFACPKGLSIGELHADPDRLRAPLVDGVEVTWEEAWAAVAERVGAAIERHGRGAFAAYLGNPNVHNLAGQLYVPAMLKALGTTNIFSASTIDQQPRHVVSALMYGDKMTAPIPDVDRTDLLLVLGADPMTSNGSFMTAPDMPGRLRALKARGGRLVVVDPRVSTTARMADTHLPIRPGTDALLLAAVANVLLQEGLATPVEGVAGLDRLPEALAPFTPGAVASATRLSASSIQALARDLAGASAAAVYGRMGTCTQQFGTVTTWLVDVLNILTGNLDRPGGAMFPLAAAGQKNASPGVRPREARFGRYATSVRGLPEMFSELPVAAFAEEILEGPIRCLVTVAGNPALSIPRSAEVEQALAGLDLMISVDCYLNETTRHADIVLPVPSVLERPHYDLAFTQLAVRNVANWSPALFGTDQPQEWEIHCRLAGILQGMGAEVSPDAVDAFVLSTVVGREVAAEGSVVAGRDPQELIGQLAGRGPERILDFLLRVGPYGEGFGADPEGLTLARLAEHPHGLDLGPLAPRLPEALRTVSGLVEAAPDHVLADLPRLAASLMAPVEGVVLVGRRHLRSNNSWGHNLPSLVGGSNRATLQVHPSDAAEAGLVDGGRAVVTSAEGSVTVEVEVTERISSGVVSLPHGWGHGKPGTRMAVAAEHAGVNTNVLSGPEVDPLSGNAVVNGIPVELAPA